MADRRDRIRHGRRTMGKGDRTKGGLAGKTAIELPAHVAAERTVVLGCDFHQQVVRVLAIMNRVAIAQLARGQEIGITAAANGRRLQADHRAEAEAPGTQLAAGHHHQPVDAAGLTRSAVRIGLLVQVLEKGVAVKHPLPLTRAAMQRIHLRGGWQPGRAGPLGRGKEARRHGGVVVLMFLRERVERRDENEPESEGVTEVGRAPIVPQSRLCFARLRPRSSSFRVRSNRQWPAASRAAIAPSSRNTSAGRTRHRWWHSACAAAASAVPRQLRCGRR